MVTGKEDTRAWYLSTTGMIPELRDRIYENCDATTLQTKRLRGDQIEFLTNLIWNAYEHIIGRNVIFHLRKIVELQDAKIR